ncbi:MAG: hypothetical protein IPK82_13120 [Polyangiaceae bacterium]|nr:hypothetical protein [Polyangiaceae bacterium]
MDAVPRSERMHCTTCGWLLPAGLRASCAACGGDDTPLPLVDNQRPLGREGDDEPSLQAARDAWSNGEQGRAIAAAITFEAAPRAFTSPHGPGWVAAVGSVPVFAVLDVVGALLFLEVPVVRLPQTKRVGVLRAALALCDETLSCARAVLRLDLLVLRFSARVDALSPALIRSLAREIAQIASKLQQQLSYMFDARPAIPEQGVLSAWDRLGRAQALPALAPPSFGPPVSQPNSGRPSSPSSSRAPISQTPTPPSGLNRPITLRLSIPPSLAAASVEDSDLPAILAPDQADERPLAPTMPPPPSRPPMEVPPSRPSMLPSALPNVPALGLRPPFPSTSAMRAISQSEVDAVPPTRRPPPLKPSQETATPEGRLCDLLRQALSLATALSFQQKPHTMLLLVRAAVYRAVHDHHQNVTNAVDYLFRATRSVTREIWTARTDAGRPVPVAEPALAVFEQVVASRAQLPREKQAQIEPWTSAAQAKEHLGKYLTEIELAPADPSLRYYLALGALCELVTRTRLPAPTDQRLREIIAYAQRDGTKPVVIELMMTALRKIVSG